MKAWSLGLLSGAILLAGVVGASAKEQSHHRHHNHDHNQNLSQTISTITGFIFHPPSSNPGPTPTAYGECGVGYWSNPAPGICNIDISDDMNHGTGTTEYVVTTTDVKTDDHHEHPKPKCKPPVEERPR